MVTWPMTLIYHGLVPILSQCCHGHLCSFEYVQLWGWESPAETYWPGNLQALDELGSCVEAKLVTGVE